MSGSALATTVLSAGIEPTTIGGAGMATMAAVLLAAVFAVAAVTKAIAPAATAAELADLGLPAPGLLARVVPPSELAIAVALLIAPRVGAMAAGLALSAFTAVLIATIRSGRVVSCGCLGSLSRQPVSSATVVRNLCLLAMAGAVATTTRLSVPDVESVVVATLLVLVALIASQLLAMFKATDRIWSVELAGETGPTAHRNPATRFSDEGMMT